jgi:hypothetical protein
VLRPGPQTNCRDARPARNMRDTQDRGLFKPLSTAPAQLCRRDTRDRHLAGGAARADQLALAGDHDGATTWRRISQAVIKLANQTPSGPLH